MGPFIQSAGFMTPALCPARPWKRLPREPGSPRAISPSSDLATVCPHAGPEGFSKRKKLGCPFCLPQPPVRGTQGFYNNP